MSGVRLSYIIHLKLFVVISARRIVYSTLEKNISTDNKELFPLQRCDVSRQE